MFLENEDKEKIVDYLVKNKKVLRSLPQIVLLKKQLKDALKRELDKTFHDDIITEFLKCCKIPIAEDVSRNTGLATDGIVYIIDYMGLDKFKKYIYGNRIIK